MNFQKFTTFKTILIALVLTINANQLFAQTTNGIFFQAVARDNFSNPAKDRKIYVQSSIIQTTPTGTKVLTEEHQANTDATGVFSISLGNGVRVGGTASGLATIDWSKGPFYLNLKVAITPIGGNSSWDYNKEWVDMGTTSFGAVPFALMGSDEGKFGYKLQVYTQANSDIRTMADMKGKRIAHTSPTSNSGNLAPRALFPGLGIVPDTDYEVTYSGSHDQSMLGVVAGDYDAAPVASEVVERMAARGLYDPKEVRIVWESASFPTTSYNYAYNLNPDLVKKIKEAFYTFDFRGTALGDEFEGVEKFVPITYQENWSVIREIQKANGVQYTPDQLK